MTDRNELERLLEAATKGPWAVDGPPNNQIIWSGPESRVAFMAHSDGCDVERDKATAALICFLRNNAQHYLSLMDEVERLRNRWAMIDKLREGEGCSVEIIHDNPDPGSWNCAIYVTSNFGEDYGTYYGDTIDDCLRQALGETHDR